MNNSKFLFTAMLVAFSTFLMAGNTFASSEVYGGDIEKGKELAGATGCMGCHGADGNSPVPNFPKIAGLGSKYIYRQLQNVRDGNRIIASMAGLVDTYSNEQLKDLAVFYNSQKLQITGAVPLDVLVNAGIKVDSLKIGARVYRAGNLQTNVPSCIGCHSPRGLGNEPAGYPRLGGQYPEYIAAQLRAYRDGGREHEIMNTVAKNMTNAEIDSVANFIAGLN
jgi:cytochrome c553